MRSHGFPQLRTITRNIEKILVGRAAAALSTAEVTTSVTIVPLPLWSELKPQIDVGIKAQKNANLVLPARIEWSLPPLLLLRAGESVTAEWRITNMGHNLAGSLTVTEAGLSEPVPGQLDTEILFAFSPRDLKRKLAAIAKTGDTAKWEILQSFEEYTRSKLDEANRILAQELSEYHGQSIPGVLDDIALDSLLTQMLFGEGDTSIVSRMVDKALQPDAFKDFDPARYFTLNLKSRALGEVRRTVGDPHIGSKIRRLQKIIGAQNVETLVSAYNEQYPTANLGPKRAAAALTVGAALDVTSVHLVTDEELREYSGRRSAGGNS